MEAFLQTVLTNLLPEGATFSIHSLGNKRNLLRKLPDRLCGYAKWIPENYRIVVVVDRDNDDCRMLKDRLETISADLGLLSRSRAGVGAWQVVNRIATEELEAWYFGDWEAVCQAYPRVSPHIPNRANYRDPDAIRGGTSEAFERIMKLYGYFRGGLRKKEAARAIAEFIDPSRSRSTSFARFRDAILEATA